MKDLATTFAQIVKTNKNPDGTLTVYGKATDDSLDIDQQIADDAWLSRAMPEWFMTGGNIREQHSNIAAGVAKEYEAKSDGHYISALVVDPVSVKKVETGVLKGFSIGIRAPRVVRDNKAVNGRIIDGQIVEVSLVDRPANPNCQLVLAKSVDGESTLVKVEEMRMSITAKGIVDEAIKYTPKELVKFDQALFDKVRVALAQLIAAEANEMITEGHNEEMSLQFLLGALHHVFAWYEHEEAEGEVMETAEAIEMSADPLADTTQEEETGETKADGESCPCGCAECEMGKGCDGKMCKCGAMKELVSDHGEGEVDQAVKSSGKCLECGCDKPADAHGRTDVSTAVMISPEETPKSISTIVPEPSIETLPTVTEETIEEFVEEDSASKTLLADTAIAGIIEKAVKSAMADVQKEIDLLKSAKEAVENKAATLETELATAKSLAKGGGPKRASIATGEKTIQEWQVKADYYLAKASATTDQILAKGYREMAKDFLAKATSAESK